MPPVIDITNDVLRPRIHVRLGEYVLVIDPNLYTVEQEIRVQEFFVSEAELLQANKLTEAREDLLDIVGGLVLPTNPDWTRAQLAERLTALAMGRVLSFFVRPPRVVPAPDSAETASNPDPASPATASTPTLPTSIRTTPGNRAARRRERVAA